MSCNRDSESDRVFPLEGISFIDRESLLWAKLGHPYRDYELSKVVLVVMGRWKFVNVWL